MKQSIVHRISQAARVLSGKGVTGSMVAALGSGSVNGLPAYNAAQGAVAMQRSAILAMCIGAWGLEYPQVKMIVYDRKGLPQFDHAFAQILAHPNALMDESEIMTAIAIYRIWTGGAYLHKLRNIAGLMIGIEPRHALEISEDYDTLGNLKQYIHTDGRGQRTEIPLGDVVPMPWIVRNPTNTRRGVSPLQLCWTEQGTYDAVGAFVYQFIKNGAVPGTAIIAKDGLEGEADDKKKYKEQLYHQFGLSNGGVGGSILLEGDFDVKRLSANLQELELDGLRSTPEANICGVFRVPPELIGANVGLENSTYSNKKEARRGFVENTLLPMWMNDASRLARILTDEFKGTLGWYIEPDTSRVAALKEDEDKRHERARTAFSANLISRDEARSDMGREPMDNAPVFAVDLVNKTTPLGKGERGIKSASEHDAMWKDVDDAKMAHVKSLTKALTKGVNELKGLVVADTKSALGIKKNPMVPNDATLKRIFLDGTDAERRQLAEDMVKRATEDADFDITEIRSWLDGVVDDSVGESADKITKAYGTMRDEIVEVVKANGSGTVEDLTKALDDYFAVLGNRISTIAQTTVTNATSTAQQGSWKSINKRRADGKVVENMWLSERDGDVRPKHQARDGKIASVGELIEGSAGPGLSGIADDDINCRCVLVPVTKKKG